MTMAAHTKTRPAATKANRKPVALPIKKGVVAKKAASKPAPAKPAAKKAPASKASAKTVKPVAKKAPVSKASVKPAKPVVKKAPVVKKVAVAKPAAKAAASKPAPKAQKAVKPQVKAVSKPAAKPVQKPAAKAAAKPVSKKPQPAAKKAAVPAAKSPAVKKAVVSKPAAKSGASKVVPPAKAAPAKPAAKPAPAKSPVPAAPAPAPVKQPSKPMEMSRPNPVMRQAALEAERRNLAKMKESQKKPQPVVSPKINSKSARKYQPEFLKSVLDQPTHSEQSGPMIRYSDADLQEFRELITKKLEDAKRELAYWQGIITHKGEMSGDETDSRYGGMEEGVSSDREYASQMASRRLDFIEKLEKAMMRIQNKTYGVCRVTGKLIDKARLRAVPHATLSMEAKLSMSKNPGGQNP
jgi:RNA polymerase-binding transcription factor DksA